MYQNIASGPEALTGLGIRRPDLVVLILLVSLVVPTAMVGIAALAGKLLRPRVRDVLIALSFGVILGLFCWQQILQSGPLVRYLLPTAVVAVTALLMLRSAFIRNFALFLGLAVPVVIVAFLVRYPVWAEFGPHEKAVEVPRIEKDIPVVMVVFDELPLASLENSKGRINGSLFPRFASLANTSNWYPDMTSRGSNTVNAVPAIMTGRPPTVKMGEKLVPPGRPDYPDNLCSITETGGYRLHSYEPITDLCKRNVGLGGRMGAAIRRGAGDTEQTAGTNLLPGRMGQKIANQLASPFKQPYREFGWDREDAVNDFVAGLPNDERSFNFLHITLPHIYWTFMPDGTRYDSRRFYGVDSLPSPQSARELNHDMQQAMLQLAYTDRQLGRIIDRMKEQGIWEEALFVATADHGGAFLRGGNRRILEEPNAGWLLPVPLFIKFPGQREGRIVKGSVDSLDIAPTVLDVLGVAPPEKLPGTSLAGKSSLPLDEKVTGHGSFGTVEFERSMVDEQLDAAVRQTNRIFGNGDFYSLAGRSDLIGKNPEKLGLKRVEVSPENPAALEIVDLSGKLRPTFFRASVNEPRKPGRPMAVSLNGRIVATTGTWGDPEAGNEIVGVNLPSDLFVEGRNTVEVFAIDD